MTTIDTWDTPFLQGLLAPVADERDDRDLKVIGEIPAALRGMFVRTGPNPVSGTSPHWFYGDGMVHGITLRNGHAEWYRNRFVETESVRRHRGERVKLPELAKGRPLFGSTWFGFCPASR